jgi:hypothetical protein
MFGPQSIGADHELRGWRTGGGRSGLETSSYKGSAMLSPRQARIYGLLSRLVSDGAAEFFRDACALMAEEPPRITATHQVAHALREVESALRAVLEAHKSKNHHERILSVLQALDVPSDDPNAELWLGLSGEGNPRGLAARAHRAGLEAPRPLDAEFREFFHNMESMLDRMLERFRDRYVHVFRRLDELLTSASPKSKDAERFRQKFPANQVTRQYFFTRASVAWLRPLREAGFFTSPPPPQVNEDESVSFLRWPESEYLVRVVSSDPNGVLAAALSIPHSDNSYVTWNLVQVASALPPEAGAQLVPQIISSITGPYGVIAARDVGTLVVRLARASLVDSAMALARALLKDAPTRSRDSGSIRDHDYVVVVRESMPTLVTAAGRPAFALLVELLDDAIRVDASPRGIEDGYDGSLMWRTAIERDDSYSRDDPKNALVDAIRASAIQLIKTGTMTVAEVVDELDPYRWLILRRLILDLLKSYGAAAPSLVGQYLTDATVARNDRLDREFLLLANAAQTWLANRDRQRLMALIAEGPDTDSWSAQYTRYNNQAPPASRVRRYVETWQRDRFAAIEQILPSDLRARYRILVAEHGDASDPTVPPPVVVVWDEESPVGVDDLAAMPTHSLVEFLRTWQPPKDWRQRDRSSLAGVLNSAIQQDAPQRSADASKFIGLAPDYITPVMDGLWQAAEKRAELDWAALLPLCSWVNEQAEAELAQGAVSRSARAWHRPRLALLGLLITGLNDQAPPLTADHDGTVWSMISSACQDPDPTPDDETVNDRPGLLEALTLDAVRPVAIRAAVAYGLQMRQQDPEANIRAVLSILGDHLDTTADPSWAVHATYGSLFQILIALDPAWARTHLLAIFPSDPAQQPYWRAAWNAHLEQQNLTDETWQLLRSQYARAVDELDSNVKDKWALAKAQYLGHHLARRYWFGKLTLDEPDRLLKRFYERAPVEVAAQIIATAGRTLRKKGSAEAALIERLVALWNYRVNAVDQGADPRELADFDQWFISGAFDEAWALQQLLIVVKRVPDMDLDPQVLHQMSMLAPTHTLLCLAILDQWLENEPNYWALSRRTEYLRAIIHTGSTSDPEAASLARKITSMLALRGLHLDGG